MKLDVSSKNEHIYVPDIGDNLQLPENERFEIVYKRINRYMHGQEWTQYKKDNSVDRVNYAKLLKMHILRFNNPPILRNEKGEEETLTIDILLSEKYDIFDKMINDLIDTFLGLNNEDIEKK